MVRFNADKIYYDELVAGIGVQINHDADGNFDAQQNTQITGIIDISFRLQKMVVKEILDIDIVCDFVIEENYSSFIDLLQLIPMKFRESVLLQQYLQEVGTLTGTWLGQIKDLATLQDKYLVSEEYLQKLADLVGLTIISNDSTSLIDKRRQLIQVIEWYKLKGTYKALQYIGYLLGLNINLWDLYINDYVTFVQESWFVGYEGENPGGLGSSYYKSPHLGFEILLNKVFGTGLDSYLFSAIIYTNLSTYVEIARPINVVPHYSLYMTPETDQTGDVTTVLGEIKTCVIGEWSFSRLYFDGQAFSNVITVGSDSVVDGSSDPVIAATADSIDFDNGDFFDYTDTAFYNQITKWKVGTGSKGIPPANTGWSLETVVLSGMIDDVRFYADRVEYEFELPNTLTITGISELGLFLDVGDVLEVGSTFPNIDIVPGITLKVLVTVQIA